MIWSKITAIADEDNWFFISDQMCPADVSRLQHPGVRAYLQYCKCCKFCFVIQLFSEPCRQNRGAELVQNKIELQLHQLFSALPALI